jgi:hypothetical protein
LLLKLLVKSGVSHVPAVIAGMLLLKHLQVLLILVELRVLTFF